MRVSVVLVCVGVALLTASEFARPRCEPRVVYRYVHRDLDAVLRDPESQPVAVFAPMFSNDNIRTF